MLEKRNLIAAKRVKCRESLCGRSFTGAHTEEFNYLTEMHCTALGGGGVFTLCVVCIAAKHLFSGECELVENVYGCKFNYAEK